jgi:cytochrome c-type biogenesis protein
MSVVVFTLLLKATTALLGVPPQVWQLVSGGIIILLGIDLLVPAVWDRLSTALGLQARSGEFLDRSVSRQSVTGDILTGAALGPVFSSCSPTYALIVAAVLPVSFAEGVVYVAAYAIGLAAMLLLIALLGRGLVRRLGWLANPGGWFRRVIGAIFVLVGIAVITGFDKQLQTWILDAGLYDPIAGLEELIGGG